MYNSPRTIGFYPNRHHLRAFRVFHILPNDAKVLDKKQLKAYAKATGKIKVRPVSPKTILADIESNDYSLDVISPSKWKDFADYMAKVVPSVVLPVAIAFIEIAGSQGDAIEIIFGITMKLFILVSSFISGSTSGLNKASIKNNIILNRILFLSLYDTWRAKKIANHLTRKIEEN